MAPTDDASLHALTDKQIERLAAIVDEFGRNLARTQFNDIMVAKKAD
jgi:hypothetical protein